MLHIMKQEKKKRRGSQRRAEQRVGNIMHKESNEPEGESGGKGRERRAGSRNAERGEEELRERRAHC